MDTLSSSVSSLKVPIIHSTSREFYHWKTPSSSHLLPHPHLSSTTKPNSISNKTTCFPPKNFTSPLLSSSQTLSLEKSPNVHKKAASGYAVALIDAARCNHSLEALERDVKRFSKWLRNEQLRPFMNDPSVSEKEKGQVVKEIAEKGRFHKHLVALLKMLIEKNKLGMVGEVLEEFERIYDELSGTRVVLVSSTTKMEEDRVFGIARMVQKLCGAMKMKVKVRRLVDERLPSPSFGV